MEISVITLESNPRLARIHHEMLGLLLANEGQLSVKVIKDNFYRRASLDTISNIANTSTFMLLKTDVDGGVDGGKGVVIMAAIPLYIDITYTVDCNNSLDILLGSNGVYKTQNNVINGRYNVVGVASTNGKFEFQVTQNGLAAWGIKIDEVYETYTGRPRQVIPNAFDSNNYDDVQIITIQ